MRVLRFLEDAFAWLTCAALVAMMLLITLDAIGRYLFITIFPDVFHFTELYLMPMVIFFAMAWVQRERGHVNVTLLSQLIPKPALSACLAVVFLLSGLIAGVMAYASWNAAWPHLENWRVTGGVVPWPTGLSRVVVPLGLGLLSIRLLADSVIEARRVFKPDDDDASNDAEPQAGSAPL